MRKSQTGSLPTPRKPVQALETGLSKERSRRLGASWICILLGLCVWALTVTGQADPEPVLAEEPSASGDPSAEMKDGEAPDPSEESADGEGTDAAPTQPKAHVVQIDSAIHRVAAEFIESSLQRAEAEDAEVLIIELSTPGGMLNSTRDIAKSMLKARTPVVVYVSPAGAQAASAGFFILMAADIAVMAPGTNTGAAHPVSGGGEDIEGDMGQKVTEDSAALIRSLARQNGRNVELAESAVLESKSFAADEALDAELIDFIADDIPHLLEQMDGRVVEKIGEEPVTLQTAKATYIRQTMPAYQRFLGILVNPAIAALLMGLGGLGLYMELTNPGGIFPGVFGAICLILGFYSMSVLPINYAGVALVILGVLLFVLEVQVPTFGLMTLGGSVCLILGAVMLFKDTVPDMSGALWGIGGGAALMSAIMSYLGWRAWKVRREPVATGQEGLLGEHGKVRSVVDSGAGVGVYKVFVHGELWRAESSDELGAGDTVEVTAVDGLSLRVRTSESTPQTNPQETS